MKSKVICPYCRKPALLKTREDIGLIYGKEKDKYLWVCEPCDARVGTHKGKKHEPLGTLADEQLRKTRIELHGVFDAIWTADMFKNSITRNKARSRAYAWLSKKIELPIEQTHVGMFNYEMCKKAIEICKTVNMQIYFHQKHTKFSVYSKSSLR